MPLRVLPGYYVNLTAQPGTSAEAAVASAAHDVLSYLYPAQQAAFDAALVATLPSVPDGAGESAGVTVGQSIADTIIALRATDSHYLSLGITLIDEVEPRLVRD